MSKVPFSNSNLSAVRCVFRTAVVGRGVVVESGTVGYARGGTGFRGSQIDFHKAACVSPSTNDLHLHRHGRHHRGTAAACPYPWVQTGSCREIPSPNADAHTTSGVSSSTTPVTWQWSAPESRAVHSDV